MCILEYLAETIMCHIPVSRKIVFLKFHGVRLIMISIVLRVFFTISFVSFKLNLISTIYLLG